MTIATEAEAARPSPPADNTAVVPDWMVKAAGSGSAPTEFEGVRIVSDVRAQNLPHAPFNYRAIDLEDGSRVYGCIDCPGVIMRRRDNINRHRRAVHNAPKLGDTQASEPDETAPEPQTLPIDVPERAKPAPRTPRREDSRFTIPAHVAAMTVGDFIEVGLTMGKLADQLGRIEAERDGWKDRALASETREKAIRKQLNKLAPLMKLLEEEK